MSFLEVAAGGVPDFLDRFLEAAAKNREAKILGAKIYRYHQPATIDHLGGFWDEKKGEFHSLSSGMIDDDISFVSYLHPLLIHAIAASLDAKGKTLKKLSLSCPSIMLA